MISEGSRDTEDWSNDAENSALITGILHSKIHSPKGLLGTPVRFLIKAII